MSLQRMAVPTKSIVASMVLAVCLCVASSVSYAETTCPKTARTLSLGMRGEDVSSVQRFLATQGISGDTTLGTFGQKTKDAVRFFQNSLSLPDTGVVDSTTYKAMLDACAEETQTAFKDDLAVSATRGKAPFTTKVTATIVESSDTQFLLDFGDGTKPTSLPCNGANACTKGIDYRYVFKKSGNYPVSLFRAYSSGGAGIVGGTGMSKSLVKQILVQVDDAIPAIPPRLCKEWFNGCVACTRTDADEDFVCPKKVCMGAFSTKQCTAYFAINQPPEISVIGPNNVERNVKRTWSIEGYDPEGTRLSYAFDWGDSKKAVDDLVFTSKATAVYAYKTKGTYTVTVYAKDAKDGVGSASMTVRVRDSLKDAPCGREYQPVCARKKVCAKDGTQCSVVLKNYLNSCQMKKDEGILVSVGSCN